MVIDKTKGINNLTPTQSVQVHLWEFSNIHYSPVKKQSENPTTATSWETECIFKLKQTFTHSNLIYNRNKFQSRDLPVPSLPVLPTDLPLLLPSRFYPLPNAMARKMHISFKFSKWRKHFSMKKVIMNLHNGYSIWVTVQGSCSV